jgi:hypothetical protein
VGGFHKWVAHMREADAAMHLTFASAAAILPIAAVNLKTGGALSSPQGPTGGGSPESEATAEPASPAPPKKATPRRPPARPRMIFHSPLGL